MASILLDVPRDRPTLDGTGMGIGAGAVMLLTLAFASLARGGEATLPLHFTASLVLGPFVIGATSVWYVLAGSFVNIGVSALYGRLYGSVLPWLPPVVDSWSRTVLTGLVFGAAASLFGMQLVARAVFPWLLQADQLAWFAAHTFVFGPVLAVMYEIGSRRERVRLVG